MFLLKAEINELKATCLQHESTIEGLNATLKRFAQTDAQSSVQIKINSLQQVSF